MCNARLSKNEPALQNYFTSDDCVFVQMSISSPCGACCLSFEVPISAAISNGIAYFRPRRPPILLSGPTNSVFAATSGPKSLRASPEQVRPVSEVGETACQEEITSMRTSSGIDILCVLTGPFQQDMEYNSYNCFNTCLHS